MTRLTASRDANDATWYALEYASDFRPRTDPALRPWMTPQLDPTLFHDADRHALELRPGTPAAEAEVLPGLAVGIDGRIYRVDPSTGQVLVCCGEICEVLVRERGALASAAGLAVDCRGLLFIADPSVHRVLVVNANNGSLESILAGLKEPVDVACAPNGRVYVADRSAGRIVIFSPRFERCGEFVPLDPDTDVLVPRPIAVMFDADGNVLVADANAPRLLRFSSAGELLGDEEAHAVARRAGARGTLTLLEQALRRPLPPFYAGGCEMRRPHDECADRLGALHLLLRVLRLALRGEFAPVGSFVSAALDGGSPGVEWHKIEVDADVPPGTWIKIQTVTADQPESLNNTVTPIPTIGVDDDPLAPSPPRFAPFEDLDPAAKPRMPATVPDRLIFSPPGRYLRVRVTLGSDGLATPSVRAIRVRYPRTSYLDLLPRVYRRDAGSAWFLEHFLALFEHIFTGVEDRYETFSRALNPAAAPSDVLTWLACLVDLSFDPSWPLARRRALVMAAMELYAKRGTPAGLIRYVEIYTGVTPVITEAFLERPRRPAFLGRRGAFLGSTTHLSGGLGTFAAEEHLAARWAHRFTVFIGLADHCDDAVVVPVVDRIIGVNKPAHTMHTLRVVRHELFVGLARVGIDAMLGARERGRMQLGGPNAVLGGQRSADERPARIAT